ncbi:polyadenylate-binding protein-interacting protein 12-like protein isoform X1 [Tanacetum coccineum]
MRDVAEMLLKLNPMAEEFVPLSLLNNFYNDNSINRLNPILLPPPPTGAPFGYSVVNDFLMQTNQTPFVNMNGVSPRRVTEEQLAALFINCGHVVDCRICGDPNSVLRFADDAEDGYIFSCLSILIVSLAYMMRV